ncbi:MAG TPA: vitamin B12-dependent ribonucleotide reductase [Dehalococcoidia bacterium]|nr:vitamin B12-dependent ribonucleotide reductase [Dehalococcoidia bacterium]
MVAIAKATNGTAPNSETKVELAENARIVLERRYLAKDNQGEIVETPEGLFRRVAHNLAQAELNYGADETRMAEVEEQFYRTMLQLDFLPNSPTLFNAGRPLQQLSACFVLPVPDSIEGIFDTIKYTAMIHQSGGGTGFAFSRLRPEGSMVGSTAGVASGPVSFMKVFDGATEAIKQGGTRRGANMGILVVDHPDIEKFIEVKADMTTLTNFNISVAITDKFMQALERDEEYDLWDPHAQKVAGHKRARELWDKLVHNAWRNGDPGLVFIDRINAANPVPQWGPIESTNPCGEQALGPFDSCNLGSINLDKFAVYKSNGWQVDWDRLGAVIPTTVRLLDNVIDMNRFPIPQIAEMSRANRRIGLGVMGFADLLMKVGVPYNSEEAVQWAERIGQFIESRANVASLQLAQERGVFPAWEGSIFDTRPDIYPDRPRYRNCTRTTIAPTGTISIIADCSSGIEPVFALAFMRQHYLDRKEAKKPTQMTEVNEYFLEIANERGFYSEDLMSYLAQGGSLIERLDVPEDIRRVFVTAHDIEPEWHVRIQAAFQRHIDNGVSKTINFGHGATPDDVENAYLLAYQQGCKGITIYRDGSRDLQVLSHQGAQKSDTSGALTVAGLAEPAAPRRRRLPDERQSLTHKFRVGDQEGYLTVGLYEDGSPGEVFIKVSKQGSTVSGLMDTIALLTSISLQYGVPLEVLSSKLKGSRFEPSGMTEHPELRTATSLVDYIFRFLEYKFVDGGGFTHEQLSLFKGSIEVLDVVPSQTGMACPECGSLLHFAEGCMICRGCGYSKCG